MKTFPNSTVKMLQFPALARDCDISHFVTTRQGGVSRGNYASFNPGAYSGDDLELVCMNRKILSDAIGISSECIFVPFQVHGCTVRSLSASFLSLDAEEQNMLLHGVDALVTDVPGICIAVTTADCVPVLVYAPDKKVVAAIHAGWRGTVQQIVARTIHLMIDEYGANPSLMQAGIAPSIGPEAFEVGEEVVDVFRDVATHFPAIINRNVLTGKAHINLWEANRLQLLEAGLQSEHIEVSGICTYTHHETFFSARRLGINSGRILSGIFLINKG